MPREVRADLERAFEEAQAKRDADRRVADEALLEARRDAESKLQESKVLVRKAEDLRVEAERSAEASSRRCAELEQQLQRERWERDDDNRRGSQRVSELEERLSASKHAFERSRDEASERRTELERRLDAAAESLRKESDRRATELSELRDAHQASLEKTLAEQQALRDACVREALRAERQQNEVLRERSAKVASEAVENARRESRERAPRRWTSYERRRGATFKVSGAVGADRKRARECAKRASAIGPGDGRTQDRAGHGAK